MAQYTRTFSTVCPGMLLEAINENVGITPSCVQIVNYGTGDLIFDFDGSLSAGELTTLDGILASWECPTEDPGTPADETVVNDSEVGEHILWSSDKINDMFQSGVPSSPPTLYYEESAFTSSTTSTGYQQKVRLTATVESGLYLLQWSAEVQHERYTWPMGFRIQLNDSTTLSELSWQPITFDSYGTPAPVSGFARVSLATGTHNFDMDYRTLSSGRTARISRARLGLMKVSD